jgi:3-oxoacyl-[acyl-carrier protein] reductase
MELGISGKVALVLGGGGGLGGAIAASLAREGARVAVADLNEAAGAAVVRQIEAAGGAAHFVALDLGNAATIAPALEQVVAALGPIDILVNNSGGPPPTTAAGVETKLWEQYFRSMVLSIIALTDQVLPGMRARGWGRIITSTSSGVVSPIANLGLSNALRLTLVGWSKTLAGEVGQDGVTVNIILPGRVATGRIRELDEKRAARESKSVDDVVTDSTRSIALRRYGLPEEYGDAVAFLASARASYITGSVFRVDGGLIASI